MAVKWTIQGMFIYAAMAAYLLSFAAALLRQRRLGHVMFGAGFLFAVSAFAWRWSGVGHVPLQNLFEVFLTLGMLMWPISLLCRKHLRTGGEAADAFIAAVLMFPPGFVMSASVRLLPPALQSPLFVPHVGAYMLATVIMAKAAAQATVLLIGGDKPRPGGLVSREQATWRIVCLGFPPLTAGLLLGAIWGKLAWGDYWNWDPKEMWSLAAWLVLVGYFHFRAMFGRRHSRVNAAWVLTAAALIIITLLWVNLSKIFTGLHSYA